MGDPFRIFPTAGEREDEGALPSGWERHLDRKFDTWYYWHRETGESTWEKPAGLVCTEEAGVAGDDLVQDGGDELQEGSDHNEANGSGCFPRYALTSDEEVEDERVESEREQGPMVGLTAAPAAPTPAAPSLSSPFFQAVRGPIGAPPSEVGSRRVVLTPSSASVRAGRAGRGASVRTSTQCVHRRVRMVVNEKKLAVLRERIKRSRTEGKGHGRGSDESTPPWRSAKRWGMVAMVPRQPDTPPPTHLLKGSSLLGARQDTVSTMGPCTNVLVRGLPLGTTDQDLIHKFSMFGCIVRASVFPPRVGFATGLVEFGSRASAENMVSAVTEHKALLDGEWPALRACLADGHMDSGDETPPGGAKSTSASRRRSVVATSSMKAGRRATFGGRDGRQASSSAGPRPKGASLPPLEAPSSFKAPRLEAPIRGIARRRGRAPHQHLTTA